MPGRYAVHAVVRYTVAKRSALSPARVSSYYVRLLERDPRRFEAEQTHLFAAMDDAHRQGQLGWILRIDALFDQLMAGSQ